jgi:hypothetical protein
MRGYHQCIFLPFMTCLSQQRITVMQSIQDRCAAMDSAGRHPHHGTDVRDSWDGNPRRFLHAGCLPPMWFSLHRRARPSSPSLMDRPVFMEMQSCDHGLWGGAVVPLSRTLRGPITADNPHQPWGRLCFVPARSATFRCPDVNRLSR